MAPRFVEVDLLRWLHTTPILLIELGDVGQELAEAVDRVLELPSSDVTSPRHGTYWTRPTGEVRQWSLYNRTGDTASTRCDHDCRPRDGKRLNPVLPESWRHRLLSAFPLLTNLRLNLLGPGASLAPHRENTVVMAGPRKVLKARFHLPVRTSTKAGVRVGDRGYRMERGAVYFFNNAMVHAAWNGGCAPRLHLVWDALVDGELLARMSGGAQVEHVEAFEPLSPVERKHPGPGEYAVQSQGRPFEGVRLA